MEHREQLLETIDWQQAACVSAVAAPCPFYADVLGEVRVDVLGDGPIAQVLAPHAHERFDAAYLLRLLGGTHRMALSGESPELARHFPSTGGDGNPVATTRALQRLLGDGTPSTIVDALSRPPQTNEVGRAAALASGCFVLAAATGLPLRVRELGSSGGLNLRLDRYRYEQAGSGAGHEEAPVRFVDQWPDGHPPFAAGLNIVERRGCDRDPIDVTTDAGAMTLLSYVWPQPRARFATARAAIDLAREAPVEIDRADADVWLPAQLAPHTGTALVVYHSIMWQYLGEDARAVITDALDEAGAAATADAPLAWLRLEPNPETYMPAELRLTVWDGTGHPRDDLLATTGFHGGVIHWLGDA